MFDVVDSSTDQLAGCLSGPQALALSEIAASEGRQAGIDIHSGALQTSAVLATRLQLLRLRAAPEKATEIDELVHVALEITRELRRLITRVEGPRADGDDPSLDDLGEAAHSLTGVAVRVTAPTEGYGLLTTRTLLDLGHRALIEMSRAGGTGPARIVVRSVESAVVLEVSMTGERVDVPYSTSTLAARAALLGGTGCIKWTPQGPRAELRVPAREDAA